MKIIVLGLDRKLGNSELRAEFAKFGKVDACEIVMDADKGTSKGFGFVEMSVAAEAKAAIAGLHGKKIGKEKVRVKEAD